MTVKVLCSGIDTLHLNTAMPVRKEVIAELAALKKTATERRAVGNAEPVLWSYLLDDAGGDMVVKSNGSQKASFIVQSPCWDLLVHSNPPVGMPSAYVELRAAFLWAQGWPKAGGLSVELLGLCTGDRRPETLGRVNPQVGRIDLAADFMGWQPQLEDVARLAGRARKKGAHFELYWDGRRFTGFELGKGAVVCRLYNKSVQIIEKGLLWMRQHWHKAGWRDDERDGNVWRLEFQLRRDMLRDAHVIDKNTGEVEYLKTWPAAAGELKSVWRYLATSWCSMRQPRTGRQRIRLTPEWEALVAGADFPGEKDAGLYRRLLDEKRGRTWPQIAGYLLKGVAERWQAEGRPTSPSLEEEVGRVVLDALKRYQEKRGPMLEAATLKYQLAQDARVLFGDSAAQLDAFNTPTARA